MTRLDSGFYPELIVKLNLRRDDMALIRWEPARELSSLQSEMNRLFTTFFETPTPGDTNAAVRRWHPAMDLVEADEHYILRADLPGTDPKDVKIELEDRVLTISGERKSEQEERQQGFFRVERASGFFARSLTLPEGIDPASIEAA